VPGIAVVGTDHPHVVELVQHLVDAGATVRAIVATDDGIGPWLASQYPDARTSDPYADDVDVVVTAAVPCDRAAITLDAARAGKAIVSDKPGVTTRAQLDAIRASNARWLVVFGERLGNPAMVEALRLVAAGAIGQVVHTVGLGPHTLNLAHRPPWFFDPVRYGGILVDIGSHQVDQFLAFTGATDARVRASTVRRHDDHPGVQVLGEMLLETPAGVTGYSRVDYFTPKGLGSWGDVRLTVVGTEGFVEVRAAEGKVVVVDGESRREVDCRNDTVPWAAQLLDGAMPIDQQHVFSVHDICLRAQEFAGSG